MICPFCLEDVPADSRQHVGCKVDKNNKFPAYYVDHHGREGSPDPIVLSVVGFGEVGKTIYLCALFDYLDKDMPYMWPDFFNRVLDQTSLSILDKNRRMLREGSLPPRTDQSFPRPGIFRLTNMPRAAEGNGLPPLEDTTVLIYDPPGEAVETDGKIVEFAGFVRRSKCVLFLVDLATLGRRNSIADEMGRLLETYVLGMRLMGIEKRSQHLIVVYTKSDEMKVSLPEFRELLEREPALSSYLDQPRPATLVDPGAHLRQLEEVSRLLEKFTWSDLNAAKFIHVAKDWFASVSYTAVSSLGAAPELVGVGNGARGVARDDNTPLDLDGGGSRGGKRLTVRMSPRGVVDPLLYVLAKSLKYPPPISQTEEQQPPPPPPKGLIEKWLEEWPPWTLLALILGGGVLLLIVILVLLAWAWPGEAVNENVPPKKATGTRPPSNTNAPAKPATPKGMVYVPGGEFIMGSSGGDDFERPPHRVSVEPFFIDQYEVTRADYARFVEQTGHSPPPGWVGGQPPSGTDRRPVTNVSWDDAAAYAEWADRRLPTEKEWEFAARGADGRSYPWGSEWRAGVANAGGVVGGALADVGVFKGTSPFGVYDMAGNVWEWTASPLAAYPGGVARAPKPGDFRVIRGGSWSTPKEQATATYRGYLERDSGDTDKTGFRCAKDVAH